MRLILTVISLFVWGTSALARDCEERCTQYYNNFGTRSSYTDPFCVLRCNAEAEIAQNFGVKSCDFWAAAGSGYSTYFWAARDVLQSAHNRTEIPEDANQCHQLVDGGALGVSAIRGSQSAYEMWQRGWELANSAGGASAGVAGWAVAEGAKHLLHCACKRVNYSESGISGTGTSSGANNLYYYSGVRQDTGKFAVYWGSATNRSGTIAKVKNALDGDVHRFQSGYFSSDDNVMTEVICDGRAESFSVHGSAPLKKAYDWATGAGLRRCLFKVTRGTYKNDGLDNMMFSNSWRSDGGYSVYWGLAKDGASTIEKAKSGTPGYTQIDSGIYSSNRPTQTTVRCNDRSESTGELEIGGGIIFRTFGLGSKSLDHALSLALKNSNYNPCKFDTEDRGFGTLVRDN